MSQSPTELFFLLACADLQQLGLTQHWIAAIDGDRVLSGALSARRLIGVGHLAAFVAVILTGWLLVKGTNLPWPVSSLGSESWGLGFGVQ